jgi:hypothetical protein
MQTYKKQYIDELLELELSIFKTQEDNEASEYDAWEKENN